MLLVSDGFKAGLLGGASFATMFAAGEIRIFASPRAASANDAQGAAPVAVVQRVGALPGLQFQLVDTFVVPRAGDLWMANVLAAGSPVWFRLVAAGDDGGFGSMRPRVDGDVSLPGGGGDLLLAAAQLVPGTAIPINAFWYTIPPLQAA